MDNAIVGPECALCLILRGACVRPVMKQTSIDVQPKFFRNKGKSIDAYFDTPLLGDVREISLTCRVVKARQARRDASRETAGRCPDEICLRTPSHAAENRLPSCPSLIFKTVIESNSMSDCAIED